MNKNTLVLGVTISCLFIVLYFSFQNEYCEGGADNYWHYFFSKYSFHYPKFFLHHWGKPVFILLSSPFAQFGINGIKLFNTICGILSAIVCYRFCNDVGLKASWLVIPILIFSPLYFVLIQSALTEPLFGLILISSSYLLFKESFVAGTILASCLLFSRTEGLFIVMYYCLYLLVLQKWKYVPLLATAFIIYALIGLFSGHNFLWFFTEIPYSVDSPYGHGDWMHFFKAYDAIFGLPHIILLVSGFLFLIATLIKERKWNIYHNPSKNAKALLLIFVPALLFFIFHVVSWRYGKFGSAGLERVFVCIIPCTAILCMYSINGIAIYRLPKWIIYAGVLACLYFIISCPFTQYHLPLKAHSDEKAERQAAEWLRINMKKDQVIYYAHPAIVFYADRDPFDKEHNKECFEYYKECDIEKDLPFYYFWDNSFSEFSCKTSIKDIENCPNLKRVKEFKEDNFQLCVYECIPDLTANNKKDPKELHRISIHLKAANNKYICTEKPADNAILADSDNPWKWETYSLITLKGENQYAILACNNRFLCAEMDKQGVVTATRQKIGEWETLSMIKLDSNIVAFKASNGKYLTVDEKSFHLFANGDSIGNLEKFELTTE